MALRLLAFAIPVTAGAIAVAAINATYGSPLMSGYDLTDAYVVGRVAQHSTMGGWLMSAETPFALASRRW
jgi:hypothetical protein